MKLPRRAAAPPPPVAAPTGPVDTVAGPPPASVGAGEDASSVKAVGKLVDLLNLDLGRMEAGERQRLVHLMTQLVQADPSDGLSVERGQSAMRFDLTTERGNLSLQLERLGDGGLRATLDAQDFNGWQFHAERTESPMRPTSSAPRATGDAAFRSNRQLLGVDDASADRSLQDDPSLLNVLRLTAVKSAYDLWDGLTAGFVSHHDDLVEATARGYIDRAEYLTRTAKSAAKSAAVATASAYAGGWAGQGTKAASGAALVARATGAGALTGAGMEIADQGLDIAIGERDTFDPERVGTSALLGGAFGAVPTGIHEGTRAWIKGRSALSEATESALRNTQIRSKLAGYTQAQTDEASAVLLRATSERGLGDDIIFHGSRARGVGTRLDSDVDIAIRLDPAEYEAYVRKQLGNPNPGSAKERTLTKALESGKLDGGRAGLRNTRNEVARVLGISPPESLDLSVVCRGSSFDKGPVIRAR